MSNASAARKLAALALLVFVGACSDSGTEGSFEPPPIIEPVTHPFFADGALYGFFKTIIDAETAEYETLELLRPDSGIMVALDTDAAQDTEGEPNETFLSRSAIPEFVVYADDAMLYAYELATQHTHTIFDFRAEQLKNASVICDLQPSVRLEEENLEQDRIVYIDEQAVFARASISDCSSGDENDYLHYKVSFTEGDDFYSIRVEEEDPDAEEGDPQTRIATKRFRELVGQRKPVDRALMYARAPIADLNNDRIGYLGFNPDTMTWKFYLLDIESNTVRQQWSMTDANFAPQIPFLTRNAFPASNFFPDTRQANFTRINASEIAMNYGASIVTFELNDIFDDDRHVERENRLASPIYTFQSNATYTEYQSNGAWFFRDGNRILSVGADGTQRLLRDLTSENLLDFDVFTTQSSVALLKHFSDGTYSVTLVAKSGGLERTLLPRDANPLFNLRNTGNSNNHIFLEQRATPATPNVTARFLDSGEDEILPPLDNSIWTFFDTLKGQEQSSLSVYLARAQTTVFSPQTGDQVLFEPNLYSFNTEEPNTLGTLIARIPDTIASMDGVWEYDQDYGIARIKNDLDSNQYKLYFFDPIDFEEPDTGDLEEEEEEEEAVRLTVMLPMYDSANPPSSE